MCEHHNSRDVRERTKSKRKVWRRLLTNFTIGATIKDRHHVCLLDGLASIDNLNSLTRSSHRGITRICFNKTDQHSWIYKMKKENVTNILSCAGLKRSCKTGGHSDVYEKHSYKYMRSRHQLETAETIQIANIAQVGPAV